MSDLSPEVMRQYHEAKIQLKGKEQKLWRALHLVSSHLIYYAHFEKGPEFKQSAQKQLDKYQELVLTYGFPEFESAISKVGRRKHFPDVETATKVLSLVYNLFSESDPEGKKNRDIIYATANSLGITMQDDMTVFADPKAFDALESFLSAEEIKNLHIEADRFDKKLRERELEGFRKTGEQGYSDMERDPSKRESP